MWELSVLWGDIWSMEHQQSEIETVAAPSGVWSETSLQEELQKKVQNENVVGSPRRVHKQSFRLKAAVFVTFLPFIFLRCGFFFCTFSFHNNQNYLKLRNIVFNKLHSRFMFDYLHSELYINPTSEKVQFIRASSQNNSTTNQWRLGDKTDHNYELTARNWSLTHWNCYPVRSCPWSLTPLNNTCKYLATPSASSLFKESMENLWSFQLDLCRTIYNQKDDGLFLDQSCRWLDRQTDRQMMCVLSASLSV